MEIGKCEVRLAGDVLNTVQKSGVTPAEIIVLRAIHGSDAVVNVQMTGNDRRESMGEYNRLAEFYRTAQDEREEPIVPKLFAGARMGLPLPISFKEIGIDIYDASDVPSRKEDEAQEVTLAREILFQAIKDDEDRKAEEAKKRGESNQELADKINGKGEDKEPADWKAPAAPASSQG